MIDVEELAWREKLRRVRLDGAPPGQEVQVDVGAMGLLLDPESGKKRELWALIVTLVFSRHRFVWSTFLQTTEVVCDGLDRGRMSSAESSPR